MAPRANWQGYLKLSLVSCAVALFPASSTRERVSFNTINRKTGSKVKRIYVDPDSGEEVVAEDQVKGYAVGKNQFVLFEAEELDGVKIESSHTIDIEKFVPRAEIDPRYLEAPYYIAPNDKVAQEAFAVIREAMKDAQVVGLGRVVIARRERVVVLEPLGRGLLGTVLRFGYEVRGEDAYFEDIPDVALPDEMKELAHLILDRKKGHFDPAEFKDRYEDALVSLVQSKQTGEAAPAAPERSGSNVVDLMEALRRSIAGAGGKAPGKAAAGKAAKASPPPEVEIPRKPAAKSKGKADEEVVSPAKKTTARTRKAG